MKKLLLNCDMGESFGLWKMGNDEAAIALIDQANLACGFHASDPVTMRRSVELAAAHGVSIGAHPSYPDLVGFGRRHMACSPDEVFAMILYQAGALEAFCRARGKTVDYVKPHGMLNNDMAVQDDLFIAALKACAALGKVPLMVPAGADNSRKLAFAEREGVPVLLEGYADRAYRNGGEIVPRSIQGAVHRDPDRILEQAVAIASGRPFAGLDGKPVTLTADTLCVHGDNAESIAVLSRLRSALDAL